MPESVEHNLLHAIDIVKHYPVRGGVFSCRMGWIKAVDGVSLTIRKGETMALVGESGCGKTTLARLLLRVEDPTYGEVFYHSQNILQFDKKAMRPIRREMQMIFQDSVTALNPKKNIGSIIAEPLLIHGIRNPKKRDETVAELLRLVGLKQNDMKRFPHHLSEGQYQRVVIARALALKPTFIVCDDIVSSLNPSIRAQILNLLIELQNRFGFTYLFISRKLDLAAHVSDRIAVMYLGKIVEISGTDDILENPMHPYTRALIFASRYSPDKIERTILTNDAPPHIDLPQGCRFQNRCDYRQEICIQKEPELIKTQNDHFTACFFADQI